MDAMTVKELREVLEDMPEDAPVTAYTEWGREEFGGVTLDACPVDTAVVLEWK